MHYRRHPLDDLPALFVTLVDVVSSNRLLGKRYKIMFVGADLVEPLGGIGGVMPTGPRRSGRFDPLGLFWFRPV